MLSILVVDDDTEVRFMMRVILERAGYQVTEAVDGVAAIEAVRREMPDLIVTDLMMPVMGGDELVSRLRGNPATRGIKVLAVSAHRDHQTAADARVDKPFHPNVLVDAVKYVLDHKPRPARVDTPRLG